MDAIAIITFVLFLWLCVAAGVGVFVGNVIDVIERDEYDLIREREGLE